VWKISLSLCQARIARTWSELAFDADCGRQDRGPEDPSGAAVEQSKQQVAEYKRFRELSGELIEISDRICDLRLKDLEGAREVETKKNAMAANLQGEIAREIEELFGSQALEEIDFEALERAMRRRGLQLAARLLEQRFNRDHGDYQGSSLPCACGRRARYVERRWKSFHSVVGELKLERAYYYCWECERGFCPRDRALGMDATSFSPAVVRMIGTVGPWSASRKAASC